jgi:hypothetical protein
MNNRIVLVGLSLLGLGQLMALLTLARPRPAAQPPTAAPPVTAPGEVEPRPVQPAPAPVAALAGFRWASLESTNYVEYIHNLRAFGVPEQTVRDIIIADVNKLYAPLEAPLKAAMTDRPADRLDFAARRAALQAQSASRQQFRELERQKNTLLKTLLGVTVPQDFPTLNPQEAARFQSAFNALPPEKRDTVREIQENYWLAFDELRASSIRRGPEYTQAQARLKAERAAQLAKALTPAELEEFEMRTSPLGVDLTETLTDFQATEAEYRQIFRIRKQLEDGDAATAALSPVERETRAEEQIKALLGETRYAEYERAQDPAYQELTQLGQRYGLSKESIERGYTALSQFRAQQERIEDNDDLSAEQQEAALKALRVQLEKNLTDTFGEKAARAFKRQSDLFLDDELP